MVINEYLNDKSVLIDVPELNIVPCEGNVSRKDGNSCGLMKAKLKDKDKNPTGYHRCWASINEKDDELWKISKELFESNAVIFFTSVRWGQANMFYQKLIERLTWIENRHETLGESNIVENIQSGFICTGQNWKGMDVVDTQKQIITHNQPRLQNIANWFVVRLLVNVTHQLRHPRIRLHQIQTRIRPHKIALTQYRYPLPTFGKILLFWNNHIIGAARKRQHQQTRKLDES
jgi:multimeric flavodoxin WrbA